MLGRYYCLKVKRSTRIECGLASHKPQSVTDWGLNIIFGLLMAKLHVLAQAEWWVLVGHQQGCVGAHPQTPAIEPDDEIEQGSRILPGRQDGEPGEDHCKESGY